jgi:hypothetical protein
LTQNNITLLNIDYIAQADPDYSCGNNTCHFSAINCDAVQELGKCYEKGIFWVRKEDMKSITQEIKEWKDKEISDQVPGTKYDQGKLQYTLVPPYALQEVARNLTEGLKKYKERNNWQKVEGAEQRYMDALMRHFEAIRRGEIYDVDSSDPTISHMSAVAVNAMFLLEFMYNPELQKEKTDLALPKTL